LVDVGSIVSFDICEKSMDDSGVGGSGLDEGVLKDEIVCTCPAVEFSGCGTHPSLVADVMESVYEVIAAAHQAGSDRA